MIDPNAVDPVILHRRQLFTAALRSGRFQQGQSHLHSYDDDGTRSDCCLGVACIIAEENGLSLDYIENGYLRFYLDDSCEDGELDEDHEHTDDCYTNDISLPAKVHEWYDFGDIDPGLDVPATALGLVVHDGTDGDLVQMSASTLNDEKGFNFAQIADAFDNTYVHPAVNHG